MQSTQSLQVQAIITPRVCARGNYKVIGRVRLSPQKTPVFQIQAVLLLLNTFKLCKTCLVCASFTRYSLQMLKILCFELASWAPHPDTWPPCEMTVSVLLGFTLQRAFVRRWFVPVLKHMHSYVACGVCALQSSSLT